MVRVPVTRLAQGDLALDADASHYLGRVRRLAVGDAVVLFDPAARLEADATVSAIGKAGVTCRVGALRPASVRATREVVLLQGIGKGDKLDAIVRDATELGATCIVACETARTIVRLGAKGPARLARWRKIAGEAARQSGRGDAPEVLGPLVWDDAIESVRALDALKLCAWENATDPVGPRLSALEPLRAVVVAVGPEGGLEPGEVEHAARAGFAAVSLGPFTLRTETVAAALLGAILFTPRAAPAR